jgi:pimeloyl-ACP methyl ester carboxylesterase
MQPFYFGSSKTQLFGIYHTPEAEAARSTAIVLCCPLGHEYLRAHRAFRNLAVALAGRGYHVLRFDYFGVGDSSGEAAEVSLHQCLEDLGAAIEELKDTAGVTRVSLIGLRMGATLAAMAAARRRDIDRLVLWDPALDGRGYIEELTTLQRVWLEDRMGAVPASVGRDELIGFVLTDAIRAEFEAATLSPFPKVNAKSVDLMLSERRPSYARLVTDVQAAHHAVTCTVVDEPGHWTSADLVHQILLPHAMIRSIVALMTSQRNG